MEIHFGNLSFRGVNSFFEESVWLLLSGFPDARQAGIAATNFIRNVRHLTGGRVAVTGVRTSIDTSFVSQPIIIMSDINAAGSLMDDLADADMQAGLAIEVSAGLIVPDIK